MLAAYIALDLKDATRFNAEQAQLRFRSLDEWYRKLPPSMQLRQLNFVNPLANTSHTKRSLLQLHTLFLGLFIEPYRSCLIDIGNIRLGNLSVGLEDMRSMKRIEEQCILAARQSARVASLLQIDNLIRSHCWVVVYTSFTGCAVLLFSASQNLLLCTGEEIDHDLSYASSHMNLLSLCSHNSNTARTLYTILQLIFNDIREVIVTPTYRAMRELHLTVTDEVPVSHSHPNATEEMKEMNQSIRDIAERIILVLKDRLNI